MALRSKTLMIVLAMLVAGAASAGYTPVGNVNPQDDMAVHRFRLDNGLLVYLSENHEAPDVYAEIVVRAGGKDDPADATGLSHYLEHLMFKGSQNLGALDYRKEKRLLDKITMLYEKHFNTDDVEKRKKIYRQINEISQEAAELAVPNELDKLYGAMGASINAFTTKDATVYRTSFPANRLDQWLTIETDRFLYPVFRLFHTELEVVYEEKNRSLDNPDRQLYALFMRHLFPDHPYGTQTVLGTPEHLKSPSLVKIRDHYDTYYVPNNMAVCISGDIDIEQTIRRIDDHFSAWKKSTVPERTAHPEIPIRKRKQVDLVFDAEESIAIGFRTVPRNHPDVDALTMLDMCLDNSVAGLINLNLVQAQKVKSAYCYPDIMNERGAQVFGGVPKEGQSLKEVENLILEQIDLLKRGEIEDWTLPAILNDFKKSRMRELEANGARVAAMRRSVIADTDWDREVERIDRLSRVTKKDIMRVAKKYFSGGYIVARRINGKQQITKIEKPEIDPINVERTRQSEFAREVSAMPVKPRDPEFIDPNEDYKIVELSKGSRLYYSRNPLNGLFSLSITVEKGSYHDDRLPIASALLGRAGTSSYDSLEIKKQWYRMGTSGGFSAGRYESAITASGLDDQLEESLALVMDLVKNPVVDGATFETLKEIILKSRRESMKKPGTLVSALDTYNHYDKNSRYLRRIPADRLTAMPLDEALALPAKLLELKRRVVYVGPRALDDVVAVIKKHLGAGRKLKKAPPYPFLTSRKTRGNQILFLHKDSAQTRLRVGFGTGEFDEDDTPAAQVFNEYFNGMSGIVYQELREARALAYYAGAGFGQGRRKGEQNKVYGVIECQPDKLIDALTGMISLIDDMPVAEEHYAEAFKGLITSYRNITTNYRGVIPAILRWKKLGLDVDPRASRFAKLQDFELDDMLAFHKRSIKDRPKLISIVGDKSRIDMKKLAEYGKVTEVTADNIFTE